MQVNVNLAGLPALVVPCGFTSGNVQLPVGIQFIGNSFEEVKLTLISETSCWNLAYIFGLLSTLDDTDNSHGYNICWCVFWIIFIGSCGYWWVSHFYKNDIHDNPYLWESLCAAIIQVVHMISP
jgi:hypothetical protein